MRIRSTSTDGVQTASVYVYETGSSPSSPVLLNIGVAAAEGVTTEDRVTPNFASRRSAGEIIMNPFNGCRAELQSSTAGLNYQTNYYTRSDSSAPWVQHPSSVTVRADNWTARHRLPWTLMSALDNSNRSVRVGASGGVNDAAFESIVLAEALDRASQPDTLAGVTIAEMNKTIALFEQGGRVAVRMAELLESLPSSSLKLFNATLKRYGSLVRTAGASRARRQLKRDVGGALLGLCNQWLGYRYGIMATYYDVESWTRAFGPSSKRKVVGASRADSSNYDSGWSFTDEGVHSNYEERTVINRRSTYRAGVVIDPAAVSSADRFGANRPLTTAWELVPYSFVLDWFVDFGTRLSAWEGELSVRPLGSWVTTVHQLSITKSYRRTFKGELVVGNQRWDSSGIDSGSLTEISRWTVRKANPSLSIVPRVNVKLNFKRLADGVALFATARARHNRAIQRI